MSDADPAAPAKPPGTGVSRGRFALLFAVTLVAASGNTALQSLMPTIGRSLGVADVLITSAFTLSAILWVFSAPYWAHRADRRGRRALMRLGLLGFTASYVVAGAALLAGLQGWIGPLVTVACFILGRSLYGIFGSATPAATQAYIAARTSGAERTSSLAALSSAFGLGTIVGPATAPLFIFAPLDLAGPLFMFAGIGLVAALALTLLLPNDVPTSEARGRITSYPAVGLDDQAEEMVADGPDVRGSRLRWRDGRVAPWLIAGIVGGHAQAAMFGMMGFFVMDRLGLTGAAAQHEIAVVMMAGAVGTLLAQWWLIPTFGMAPQRLLVVGGLLQSMGALAISVAPDLYWICLAFVVSAVGNGFFRVGYTAGASLAVARHEQNAVAGMVTSVSGSTFIIGPVLGVGLYALWQPLPLYLISVLTAALAMWNGSGRFDRVSAP